MNLLKEIINLAILYDFLVYTAMFGLLVALFVINCLTNAYRKTNRQLNKGKKRLREFLAQNKLANIGDAMPQAYKNQWRCFTFTTDAKPSEILTFSKTKQRIVGVWLYVALFLANTMYVLGIATHWVNYSLIPLVSGYFATFCLLYVMQFVVNRHKQRKARRIFESFAYLVDFCLPDGVLKQQTFEKQQVEEQIVDSAVTELNLLRAGSSEAATLSKITQVLKQKGLDGQRTCDQQRKLNLALNNLLQSMSRKQLPAEF